MLSWIGHAVMYVLMVMGALIAFVIFVIICCLISDALGRLLAPRCPVCREGRLALFWYSCRDPQSESYYRCQSCNAMFKRARSGPWQPVEPRVFDEVELRHRYARKANRMALQDEPPHPFMSDQEELFASRFGTVTVGLPGEEWPCIGENPMIGLCQINCGELAYRPDGLSDAALVAIFLEDPDHQLHSGNHDPWLVRGYPSLDGLVPLLRPEPLPRWPETLWISWELIEEDWPDPREMSLEMERALMCSESIRLFEQYQASKVGGWPTYVQEPPVLSGADDPNPSQFVIQITPEEKADWEWGDNGILYIGRDTGQTGFAWDIDMQCC